MFFITTYNRTSGKLINAYNVHNVDTRLEMLKHILAQNDHTEDRVLVLTGMTTAIEYSDKVIFIQ